MHIGAAHDLRGPAAADTTSSSTRPRAAAPGAALPPEARRPAAQTGRPLWVDDPSFNLEYHVRHTALPRPGAEEQLLRLAARIFSQQLDRSKPLWEMWMVEGLEDNRFALISKTHHALVDGIAGVDLAKVLFDLSPVPARVPHPARPWQPAPRAERGELVAAARGMVRTGLRRGRARRRRWPRARRGAALGARGRRGRRRGRLGGAEPGARRRR